MVSRRLFLIAMERGNLFMNWFLIVVSAIFEVAWVIGLKHSDNVLEWMLTVISICISFLLLLYLTKKLPTGTVYTIFVGLGTLGTILCEIILFDAHFSPMKMVFILSLICGIIGLKYQTSKLEAKEGDKS